jgi:hypothetical protein
VMSLSTGLIVPYVAWQINDCMKYHGAKGVFQHSPRVHEVM